jgi:hypothetical protein
MRSSSDSELAAVTAKRDASKFALERATQMAAQRLIEKGLFQMLPPQSEQLTNPASMLKMPP